MKSIIILGIVLGVFHGIAYGEMNYEKEMKPMIKDFTTYKKEDDTELKKRLSKTAYNVTQENGTEKAFNNAYYNNEEEGIYVDIVSGEPLFSSRDKYNSRTGWPSFTNVLVAENIVLNIDKGFFTTRTEVRSKYANSHLGHLFDDGPAPTYKRYCMNSAALQFIPKKDMANLGYSNYVKDL